ncbi:MAG: flagellar biosynthetic protein FliR [Isosphaeraceae bacterium]
MDLTQLDQFSIAAHAPVWIVVLARTSGVVLTAPLTVLPGMHWLPRILLSLVLGAVLIPVIEPMIGSLPSGSQLAWLALLELLVGGLLGMSAGLIVAGARQAGDIVAAQAGLSTAAILDPETGDELTALGHFYGLIALAVFLALDGPLVMVGALVQSYRTVPAGGLVLNEATLSRAFVQVGGALALSLRAAAPPALALALAGLVMGWIGRLAPAVPIMSLSLSVRSIVGIMLVFLSLATLAATLSRAWIICPWGF